MMIRQLLNVLGLIIVAVLSLLLGIRPGGQLILLDRFFSSQVFVNQSDPAQTLELKVDTSRLNSMVAGAVSQLGGKKLISKQVGLYRFTKPTGSSNGTFVWMRGPIRRADSTQTLIFHPEGEKAWSVTLKEGDSFEGPNRIVWRLKEH